MRATEYRLSGLAALMLHALAAWMIGGRLLRALPDAAAFPGSPWVSLALEAPPAEASPSVLEPLPPPEPTAVPRPEILPAIPVPVIEPRVIVALPTPLPEVGEIEIPAPAPLPRTPTALRSENPPPLRQTAAASARTPAPVSPARPNEGLSPVPQAAAGTTGVTYDAAPVPRRAIRPVYPIGARRRGESGMVTLDAAIGADGRVRAVTVQTSSSFAELDHAAQRAVAQARFTPAQRQGVPVDARVALTILFRLTE